MTIPAPLFCRPAAYRFFAAQLSHLEEIGGLLDAAVAVAMHELVDVEPEAVRQELDSLAERIRTRVRGGSPTALFAHLHGVLFEEESFHGNTQDYYAPANSYVPKVVETRCGIPITLALIYKYVADQLGLKIHGINAPAHFLVRVEIEGSWTLVDPFFGGRILTREEALQQISQMTGRPLPDFEVLGADADEVSQDPVFQTATHRDWLARILRNLREIFQETSRERDLAAMVEMFRLL
jgi:regulator of sirC expression with transglutaminase-like and TPR domain